MSSETILQFSLNRFDADLYLGSAMETNWSLELTWKRDGRPKSMMVSRDHSYGKVDFEIHLRHTYLNTDGELVSADKLFVSCLEEGQRDTCIAIYVLLSGEFEGNIIFYKANETICKSNVTTHFKILPTAYKNLSDDNLIMFNNPDYFPDVTLICGNTEYLCHKGILSARSPVFAKMLKTEMIEKQGVVNIRAIEPSALEFVLRYIYSGKTDPLTVELAEDSLYAIGNYELHELKAICVRKLKLNTTVGNVSRMFILGRLYDKSLQAHAKKFICKHEKFSEIENTDDWKMLAETYKDEALELTVSALKYKE